MSGPGDTALTRDPLRSDRADRSPEADGGDPRVVVVVGLDGSPTSWNAFAWACGEAKRLGGRGLAVFVSRALTVTAGAGALGFGAMDANTVVEYAATQRARVTDLSGEAVRRAREYDAAMTFMHCEGDAASTLTEIAVRQHADIIAIGRSTKLIHRLAGSIGQRLMHRSSQPIIAIVP